MLESQNGVYPYGAPFRSRSLSSVRSALTIWSVSTKSIFLTSRGNMTSRKRILYPQMMRCFSFCWFSHLGHLYCTYSYWKPYSAANAGKKSRSEGER